MELTLTRKPKAADAGPFIPTHPRVNLVPQSSLDRAADARARRLAIVASAGSVLLMGAWWVAGTFTAGSAADSLRTATTQGQDLAAQLALYAPVTTIATQTQALTDTVASQTATEVDHSQVINRFLAAVGNTMTVESLQITTANSSGCVSVDPFKKVPMAGCVTFTGTATGGAGAASTIITALAGDPWFVDPFIPSVGSSVAGGTPMSGTVGLTVEAYTPHPAAGSGN